MMEKMKEKPFYGTLLVVLAGIVWSLSGVLSKGVTWGGFSKTGIRALITVIILGIGRGSFKVRLTAGNVIGGAGVALTSLLYMFSIGLTTSANAIVLQYSMPVFVVLFGIFVLHEKPLRRDLLAVALVLAGVVLCCLQGMKGGHLAGDAIAVVSGMTYAVVFLAKGRKDTTPDEYIYLGNLFASAALVLLPFDGGVHFTAASAGSVSKLCFEWGTMAVMGLSLGFGYLLFSRGIARTQPTVAAIASNVEPVLNPVWVFLFIGEDPGTLSLIGSALVLITVTLYSLLPALTSKARYVTKDP